MIDISIWNETEFDTNSVEVKEKISNLVKEYIFDYWDKYVHIEQKVNNEKFYATFKIEL